MKRWARIALAAVVVSVSLFGYHAAMARLGSADAPQMAGTTQQADKIVVVKSERRMLLLRDDEVIRSYDVSLGADPTGHKLREGDEKTPEGTYEIDWRNAQAIAHLSLHISYPNAQDRARASAAAVNPGGNIMIHGLPNGWGFLGRLHLVWDWTDGCIAVTNAEMREIWSLVPNGTPIRIVDAA